MIEAYTAGFLDADGSVTLEKTRKGLDWLRAPLVSFYNCDKEILEYIQARWGGGIHSNKVASPQHNVSYHLTVGGHAAIDLLRDVLPFMRHTKKKLRAELIVEHYVSCTPRNGKYTSEHIEKKIWLAEQVMGITMRGAGAW